MKIGKSGSNVGLEGRGGVGFRRRAGAAAVSALENFFRDWVGSMGNRVKDKRSIALVSGREPLD